MLNAQLVIQMLWCRLDTKDAIFVAAKEFHI